MASDDVPEVTAFPFTVTDAPLNETVGDTLMDFVPLGTVAVYDVVDEANVGSTDAPVTETVDKVASVDCLVTATVYVVVLVPS